MSPVEKHIGYKAKLSKLYASQFYMPPTEYKEFLLQLEEGSIMNDRAAVDYVDTHGEWMTYG